LVLPPNVAPIQAIVIPCGITAKTPPKDKEIIHNWCLELTDKLKLEGKSRVQADLRYNRTVGWKYCDWELKGVPIRIEVGPKEMATGQVRLVRRDTYEVETCRVHQAASRLALQLIHMQEDMFQR